MCLVTDGGKKLVPIGQYFTKRDKFELFEATNNSLCKGTEKVLLKMVNWGFKEKNGKSWACFTLAVRLR